MAMTTVTFSDQNGRPIPDRSALALIHGDSIRLASESEATVTLYFSPDLQGALAPAPPDALSLPPSTTLQFLIHSASTGAYCIAFGQEGDSTAPDFPEDASNHLRFCAVTPALETVCVPVHGSGNDGGNLTLA